MLAFQPYRNRTAGAFISATYETSNANDNLKLNFLIKTGGVIRNAAELNARGLRVYGNYLDHFADGTGVNDRNYTWANSYFNTGYYSLLKNFGSGTVPTSNVMTFDRDGLLCVNCTDPQQRLDVQGDVRIRPQAGTGTVIATLDPSGVITRTSTTIASLLPVSSVATLMKEESFTAFATQTAFTIAYSAPAVSGNSIPLRVYRNGVRLFWVASAPSITQFTYSGTTVTTAANASGDIITVEYLN